MGQEVVAAVTDGKLDFGTWEQIFYGEFDGRRRKRVPVKIVGEGGETAPVLSLCARRADPADPGLSLWTWKPDQEQEIFMGKVVFNMTMSLDGFVAGQNDRPGNGLGDGGEVLFKWYFSGDTEVRPSEGTPMLKVSKQSAEILKTGMSSHGAGVRGRKTFDIAGAWGGHPPVSPAFIVTHHVPQEWVKEGSLFIFVTDGVESAIRQAKEAAGEKDVVLCTASILQQALNAGLVDQLHVDVAPVLLGRGVRQFEHLDIQPMGL